MQTAAEGTFPKNAVTGFNQIKANEGTAGFYKGLKPLWARQVPYTIVKFVAFEKIVGQFYAKVFTKPRVNTLREPNSWSLSCPDILLVFSAPSFPIQLTPWSPS